MMAPKPAQPQPEVKRVYTPTEIAYKEKVLKKLKVPQSTVMLQLMELGYADYDKNWKFVKKDKKPDIVKVLDLLNKK